MTRMRETPWYEHAARVGALLAVLTPLVFMARAMGAMEARLEEIATVVRGSEQRFQTIDRRVAELEARVSAEEAVERDRRTASR